MNANAYSNLFPCVGGWEDELGEDDPQGDREEQEGSLRNEKEDGRRPDTTLAEPRPEEERGPRRRPWFG